MLGNRQLAAFILTDLRPNEISPNQGVEGEKCWQSARLCSVTVIRGRGIYLLMNSFCLSPSQFYESSLLLTLSYVTDENIDVEPT